MEDINNCHSAFRKQLRRQEGDRGRREQMARTKQAEMDKEGARLMNLEKQERNEMIKYRKGRKRQNREGWMENDVFSVGCIQCQDVPIQRSAVIKLFSWRDDMHQGWETEQWWILMHLSASTFGKMPLVYGLDINLLCVCCLHGPIFHGMMGIYLTLF